MATNSNNNAGSLLLPEIGPDGLARESPVIAYTEKVIEEEQLQLRKATIYDLHGIDSYGATIDVLPVLIYSKECFEACGGQKILCFYQGRKFISQDNVQLNLSIRFFLSGDSATSAPFKFQLPSISWGMQIYHDAFQMIHSIYIEENYSKIRDVERELTNLTMEMKLTSGPKKAALEHMRKKIEMSTERVRVAKLKEEEGKKAWEAAAKSVQEEEAIKQKLCEDLNNLVQESSNAQFTRLEELKRRLEALNPRRSSTYVCHDGNQSPAQISTTQVSAVPSTSEPISGSAGSIPIKDLAGNSPVNGQNQQPSGDVEGRGKKKGIVQGRARGIGAVPKGRGPAAPGWTGAGFDVDSGG